MTLKVTVYNNKTKEAFDVSEAILDIDISTYIQDNPGKCQFKMLNDLDLPIGSTVSVQLDGHNMFKGYIFTSTQTQENRVISYVCYDQLRYLKNKDTYVFENKTSDQIFSILCNDFVLKHKVVDASSYVCAPASHDAVSLYEIMQKALDDTLINSNQWFIIRDNFGVLEHINVLSLQTGVQLGDKSGVTEYNFERSIDKDTYNQIKLYRDNDTTGKRDIFIVNDTVNGGANIAAWGILQLYEKVNDDLNLAQIEQRALGMLRLYNNEKKSLRLTSIGVPAMTAGSIFRCKINDVNDTLTNGYLLVTACTHKIKNGIHTMSIETEVVT